MMFRLALAVVCLGLCWAEQPEVQELGMARMVASKFMLSQYAVENKHFIVEYKLYNVGDKPALKVSLDDRANFPSAHFEIVQGQLFVRWDRISSGTNVTHAVVVKPLTPGQLNYTSAVISYMPTEDAAEPRYATTTAPGEGYIYRERDYDRKFSPHYSDWGVFVMMALPCIALPGLLWYKTYKLYDAMDTKKRS